MVHPNAFHDATVINGKGSRLAPGERSCHDRALASRCRREIEFFAGKMDDPCPVPIHANSFHAFDVFSIDGQSANLAIHGKIKILVDLEDRFKRSTLR